MDRLINQFQFDLAKIDDAAGNNTTILVPCHHILKDRSNTKAWTLEDWERHTVPSVWRYLQHIRSWPTSTTTHCILPAVVIEMMWTALVLVFTKHSRHAHLVPRLPTSLISASVSPIALLLSIRANQALNRLLEARKAWGLMGRCIRSITGVLTAYCVIGDDEVENGETSLRLVENSLLAMRYLSIFGWTMKATFREEDDTGIIRCVLPSAEAEWLLSARVKRPIAIIARVRSLIRDICTCQGTPMPPTMNLVLEERLYDLESSFGICNRLLMSPIPPTFIRHTSRVLCLFLFLLPLQFISGDMSNFAVLVSVAAISYTLIGLDEIGLEIAHTFPMLPLQAMAKTFQGNVINQLLLAQSYPQVQLSSVGGEAGAS